MADICNTDIEITQGYMSFEGIPGPEFVSTYPAEEAIRAFEHAKHSGAMRVLVDFR